MTGVSGFGYLSSGAVPGSSHAIGVSAPFMVWAVVPLLKVRPHQTRISRNFYARYARKMLLDHFVSKMVAYAPYAPTSLA